MTEPIFDTAYWERRLLLAPHDELHRSIYLCTRDRWDAIAERHRQLLRDTLQTDSSIFDAGCGYGRLLTLLPSWWRGPYFGVDLSPDLIAKARQLHPSYHFKVGDLRTFGEGMVPGMFDFAILVSVRHMVIGNAGEAAWEEMETNLRRFCRVLFVLEYDENDEGMLL